MAESIDAQGQRLIAAQREYYDLRAADYGNETRPSDRRHRGEMPVEQARAAIERLRVHGDVLEVACGPGRFTKELVRHASSLTALDGSPRMLELNGQELAGGKVEYVCADVFDWTPPRRFDLVFFGFWLSHVPPTHFETFWSMLRDCLRSGGRVAFVDEDHRATGNEATRTDGVVPTATRVLADGRTFDIVKVFWKPTELERALASVGWDARVEQVGDTFLVGEAVPLGTG